MESIGQKLKTAREEKGISLDQVARDTHIAKRFIAALEEEDFSAFPGDTYILGFIRNYAEYLNLDSVELVTLYKNLKIQEQPAPIEELLERKPPTLLIIGGIAAAVIVILAVGGIFLFRSPSETPAAPAEVKETAAKKYTFNEEIIEQPFIQGDEVLVNRGGVSYTIRIERIGNTVTLLGPVEKLSLKVGQEAFIELTPKGETLKVLCRNIIRNEKPPKAILHFDKIIQSPSADPASAQVSAPAAAGAVGSSQAIGSSNEASRARRSQVVLESSSKSPFTLEIEFRGYCLFRYVTDNQNREERYFRRGETFRTDVRGEIRLWYSNSGSIRARISGKEIEFGKPGEVGASLLTWVPGGTNGAYRLELIPVY